MEVKNMPRKELDRGTVVWPGEQAVPPIGSTEMEASRVEVVASRGWELEMRSNGGRNRILTGRHWRKSVPGGGNCAMHLRVI